MIEPWEGSYGPNFWRREEREMSLAKTFIKSLGVGEIFIKIQLVL